MTSRSTTFSNDPFDCIDDFGAPVKTNNFQQPNIRNAKPQILPKPSFGNANFYTSVNSTVPSSATTFDDTLNNGRSLIKPSTVNMPTIIKPFASKGKTSPTHETKKLPPVLSHQSSDESFDDDPPSPPMPTIPPPPPPSTVLDDDDETCSYAIALYDFESDVPEDLSLRVSTELTRATSDSIS